MNGPANAGTALGIPGFTADTTNNNPGIPTIALSGGYQGLGAEGTNWYQDDRTLHAYDQISYSRGRHDFMAGVDIRRMTIGRAATNQNRGQFSFTGNYSGNAAADFLTGYSQTVVTPLFQIKGSIGEWRNGFFVQDNWQATQKLTVLYGVRYELPLVPYSLNGIGRILNSTYTALIPTSSRRPPARRMCRFPDSSSTTRIMTLCLRGLALRIAQRTRSWCVAAAASTTTRTI